MLIQRVHAFVSTYFKKVSRSSRGHSPNPPQKADKLTAEPQRHNNPRSSSGSDYMPPAPAAPGCEHQADAHLAALYNQMRLDIFSGNFEKALKSTKKLIAHCQRHNKTLDQVAGTHGSLGAVYKGAMAQDNPDFYHIAAMIESRTSTEWRSWKARGF